MAQMKLAMTLALFAATVLAGAGLLAQHALTNRDSHPKETRRAASVQETEPTQLVVNKAPRLDIFGDPLPAGAVTRLGTSRFWGGGNAVEIEFSADGTKILVANWGGVFVLGASTGRQLHYFNASATRRVVNSISASPNGKYVAVGTSDSERNQAGVQIWDLATSHLLRECKDSGRQHLCALFSPDGKKLASCSDPSKTIYLWDAATGVEIRRWPEISVHGGYFTFSPDSKLLIVGDRRTIHFWNTTTGAEVRRIDNHPGGCVYRIALTRDGKTLATQALTEEPKVGVVYQREKGAFVGRSDG
jgi:WD40 repeat protein